MALTGGYGVTTNVTDGNVLGARIGLRAGASLLGIYLGGRFVYDAGDGNFGAQQGGGEVGYGFRLFAGTLTLRPHVGVGGMHVSGNGPPTPSFTSGGGTPAEISSPRTGLSWYVEPGLAALVSLGEVWFVGVDGSVVVVPDGVATGEATSGGALVGVGVQGEVGARF